MEEAAQKTYNIYIKFPNDKKPLYIVKVAQTKNFDSFERPQAKNGSHMYDYDSKTKFISIFTSKPYLETLFLPETKMKVLKAILIVVKYKINSYSS